MRDMGPILAEIEQLKKEIERKDKAIQILTDAMQAINDYSAERATRNTSFVALTDAKSALIEDTHESE